MNVIIDDTSGTPRIVHRGSKTPWTPKGHACWHCCHSYGETPLPMPIDYDDRRRMYTVSGCFCSFACMSAYAQTSRMYSATGKRGMAIFQLWRDVTKSSSPRIPKAPPRQFLDMFGGHMSIDEFRNASEKERYDEIPENCILREHIFLKKPVHESHTQHTYKPKIEATPGKSSTLKMKHNSIVPKEPERKASGPTLLERTLGL